MMNKRMIAMTKVLDTIVEHKNEVTAALDGLLMLHIQGEDFVPKIEEALTDNTLSSEQIGDLTRDLYTWFDLVRITLKHAADHSGSIGEAIYEGQKEYFLHLKAAPRPDQAASV